MVSAGTVYMDYLTSVGALEETTATKALGLGGALFSTVQTVGETYAQLAVYFHGVVTGNQAEKDVGIEAMQANIDNGKLYKALVDLTLAYTGGVEGEGLRNWVGGTSTVISYVKSYFDLAKSDNASPSAEEQANSTSIDVANGFQNLPPSYAQDLGTIEGAANVTYSTPIPGGEPQSEIDVSNNGIHFDTVADPGGNYQMFVPLQVPGFNYSSVDVQVVDPLTDTGLGSETVDMSSLTATTPLQIPTISGQCSDDDASDPDADDPDCD